MPYIYMITNKVNGKAYIGQTAFSIQKRWKEHKCDAKKNRAKNRPLYEAINKYGDDSFEISVIEECTADKGDERERYWIEHYGTFKTGYNATFGGDGKPYIDHELVIATYNRVKNQKETARILMIHPDSVANILKANEIKRESNYDVCARIMGKPLSALSSNGEFIKAFPSIMSAARWVSDNGVKSKNSGIRKHIQEVCDGKRKTAYGLKWEYDYAPDKINGDRQ